MFLLTAMCPLGNAFGDAIGLILVAWNDHGTKDTAPTAWISHANRALIVPCVRAIVTILWNVNLIIVALVIVVVD